MVLMKLDENGRPINRTIDAELSALRAQVERQAEELETYRTAFDGIEDAAELRAKLAKAAGVLKNARQFALSMKASGVNNTLHIIDPIDAALKEIGHG